MIWKKARSFDNRFFLRFEVECYRCLKPKTFGEILNGGEIWDDGLMKCAECVKWEKEETFGWDGFNEAMKAFEKIWSKQEVP